jgi:hypothetical protein
VNPSVLVQCSDTACSSVAGAYGQTDCWADAPSEPMTCDGDVYTFPRKTGAKALFNSRYYSHYICCTTSDGSPPLDRNLLVAEGVRLALGILGLGCSLVLIFLSWAFALRTRLQSIRTTCTSSSWRFRMLSSILLVSSWVRSMSAGDPFHGKW